MIGNVHIEGSSTAMGMGDEARKMGYAGRMLYHYIDYGMTVRDVDELPCKWVYVYNDGAVNKDLTTFVPKLSSRVSELVWPPGPIVKGEKRHIGVYAVGWYDDRWLEEAGEEMLDRWQLALERLEDVCLEYNVTPVIIGTPRPDPETVYFNGRRPNIAMLDRLADMTAKHTESWATYATFEDIVGADRPNCMAADTLHPNARGHSRIARFLIPLVNDILEIPQDIVPLPELEPAPATVVRSAGA
jgi:hypothetical protein